MGMIDLENFDKLPPEMQKQFTELLKQHPHLDSKLKGPDHELNTPTKIENDIKDDNEIDYSSLTLDDVPSQGAPRRPEVPMMRFQEDEESNTDQSANTKRQEQTSNFAPQQEAKGGFSPVGKQHPVLKKLRASLGLGFYQKPFIAEIGGLNYEMTALTRDTMVQAVSLAAVNSLNDNEFRANQDVAIIAFSVQKIDGVPIIDVYSIPDTDLDKNGARVTLTTWQRREKAASFLFHDIKDSPPELAEALINFYQQEFPRRNLLSDDKTTGFCPEPNCTYQRTLDAQEKGFCPYHGSELTKETDLPNPF